MRLVCRQKFGSALAVAAVALVLLAAQPSAAALADSQNVFANDSADLVFSIGTLDIKEGALQQMLADVLAEAKAELAAASNSIGLGVSLDPPSDELPARPAPQSDGRLPDVLMPGSSNSTSCGGTSVSGSSSSGSAQAAAAFFSAVAIADFSPRGRLPREASVQPSSNSIRPPTPPPRG